MDNKDLLYIEDAHNRKLFYRFTPAAVVSNFVPLVVILDEEKADTSNFEYKMWNILTPLNNFGNDNKELLQKLIKQISEEYECEEHIYLYGGHEAILHGILCKANAVYAHTPGEDENHRLKEVLNFFERVASQV